MAVVALTEAEKNTLKTTDSVAFRVYLVNRIFDGTATGGVAYQVDQTSAASLEAMYMIAAARNIQNNLPIVSSDTSLIEFMMLRMTVKDFNFKDNAVGSTLVENVAGYLNADSHINYLVTDYLVKVGKNYI